MIKNFKLTPGYRSWLKSQIDEMDLTTPKRVNIVDWSEKRGLSANNLSHVWYKQIADHSALTEPEAKSYCKMEFGISIILERGDDDYKDTLAYILDSVNFNHQSFENKVKLMSGIAITSKFTTKEMSQYMDSIQRFYGMQGINLE